MMLPFLVLRDHGGVQVRPLKNAKLLILREMDFEDFGTEKPANAQNRKVGFFFSLDSDT